MIIDPDKNAEVLDRMLPHHILIHIVDVRCIFFSMDRSLSSQDESDGIRSRFRHRLIFANLQLVGGFKHDIYGFPYIGNVIIPTDFHIKHGFYDFPFSWECHHPN
jgi:hypothetical protein